MGAAVSAVSRRIQRFNIENRAHREISKEKPTPAPAYPTTIREIERIVKENPEVIEEQTKKNKELDDRLKVVYLKSYDIKPEKTLDSGKPLPVNRTTPEETDFGFLEPKMVPQGKVTLRQALKFIAEYQSDPKASSIANIASQNNISVSMTENILKFFRTFEIYIPEKKEQLGGLKTTVKKIADGISEK